MSLAKKIKQATREHGKYDELVGQACFGAADGLRVQGRYKEAERFYLDARRIYTDVQGRGSWKVGDICHYFGNMYGEMGRYDEAMTDLRKGLRIMRFAEGERSQGVRRAFRCIGGTLYDQGKHEEALSTLEEAHNIVGGAVGPEHCESGAVLTSRATTILTWDGWTRFHQGRHSGNLFLSTACSGTGIEGPELCRRDGTLFPFRCACFPPS